MKLRSLLAALLVGLALLSNAQAQTPAPAAPAAVDPAIGEVNSVIARINQKVGQGPVTAATLAPEIAEFDQLIKKYADKPETAGSIAMMKAMLYVQILDDLPKARELLLEVNKNYPNTKPGRAVNRIVAGIDDAIKKAASKTAPVDPASLVGHPAPELHFKWSSKEGLKTLSDLKGQVVVLDFWATWCGPCLASFPMVREHVAHFKGSPVAFVGVTSIQGFVANLGDRIDTDGDPAKEISLMPQFMKAKNMTWDVAISEEEVFNPAYGIEGIPFLAIIAPDGTVRHAGLHPGDPAADVAGKIEAILKEFHLRVPAN